MRLRVFNKGVTSSSTRLLHWHMMLPILNRLLMHRVKRIGKVDKLLCIHALTVMRVVVNLRWWLMFHLLHLMHLLFTLGSEKPPGLGLLLGIGDVALTLC